MYANKRAIPWCVIPEVEIELPRTTEQQRLYTWWPVAIMNMKPGALGSNELLDYVYVICVYQAMMDQPVAWGIKISQMVDLPRWQDNSHSSSSLFVILFSAPSALSSFLIISGHHKVSGL